MLDGIHAQNFPSIVSVARPGSADKVAIETGELYCRPLVFSSRHLLRTVYLVTYTPKCSAQSLFVSQSGCCVILVLLTFVLVLGAGRTFWLLALYLSLPRNFYVGLG